MSNSTEQVWKALSDPNRRKILDQLKTKPSYTGEIVNLFPQIGRCAVMKHMRVLERAQLLTTRKEGRNKVNYINVIPIKQLYERWVRKYEDMWSDKLLGLKNLAEKEFDNQLNENDMNNEVSSIQFAFDVDIKAPVDQVWKHLLTDVHEWWPKDFYTSPKTRKFNIEPIVGGRMYEDYGDGNGLLWANVIVLDAPHVLELKGHLSPQWGGPAINFIKIELKETSPSSTQLRLTDATFGRIGENTKSELETGWKVLYGEAFKNYAEKQTNDS